MLAAKLVSSVVPSVEFKSSFYEFVGPALATANGQLVAVQRSGIWERANGDVYTGFDFQAPALVRFHNPLLAEERVFDNLMKVRIINSSMWCDDDQPQLIARFDESIGIWHLQAAPSPPMSHCTIRAAE